MTADCFGVFFLFCFFNLTFWSRLTHLGIFTAGVIMAYVNIKRQNNTPWLIWTQIDDDLLAVTGLKRWLHTYQAPFVFSFFVMLLIISVTNNFPKTQNTPGATSFFFVPMHIMRRNSGTCPAPVCVAKPRDPRNAGPWWIRGHETRSKGCQRGALLGQRSR